MTALQHHNTNRSIFLASTPISAPEPTALTDVSEQTLLLFQALPFTPFARINSTLIRFS